MRGGKRQGAGRPKLSDDVKKVAISVKLPPYIVVWLDQQDQSRAVMVEKAIIKAYKVKGYGK